MRERGKGEREGEERKGRSIYFFASNKKETGDKHGRYMPVISACMIHV